MKKEELEFAKERIEHMEKMFDEVTSAFKNDPDFMENEAMQRKVSLLRQYQESGQWLRDYELDEKGELPSELKRGILSEDGLYNLLCDIEQSKKSNSFKKFFNKIRNIF